MVTKDDLWDKLYSRLVAIANELSHQLGSIYISEILGDNTNALYKLLSFSLKERLLDYLTCCDFMTSGHALKTKSLRRYLLQKPKVQYHKPGIQLEKLHVLVLHTSERYSAGSIQEQIYWSRQAMPPLSLDDEWLKLLQDFDSEDLDASEPITPAPPTEAPQMPTRRSTAPPRMNYASSCPPADGNPFPMQLSTPIPMRNLPPLANNKNPLDIHSTPTPTRRNGGDGK